MRMPSSRWIYQQVTGEKAPRRPPRRHSFRGPARNGRYRAWIRTLPCVVCGIERGIEAAHTGSDGGRGQKSSDYSCIPLCNDHHQADGRRAWHGCSREEFQERHGIDVAGIVKRLNHCWFAYSQEVK